MWPIRHKEKGGRSRAGALSRKGARGQAAAAAAGR